MNRILIAWCALLMFIPAALAENRWEKDIKLFEARDAKKMPKPNGILFVGSSSIRMWKTNEDFPTLNIINRGFGGSQTSDALLYTDRIILNYRPRLIAIYEGDNDIAVGKSPETVFKDTKTLFGRIHEALPETRIIYVAIKPSIARWKMVDDMREANALIKAHAKKDPRIHYLDIDTPMMGPDGKPRKDLFIEDGLHLNRKGYDLWNSLIHPYLVKDWKDISAASVKE
jgi:lysophospholipase L1-like esterase